MPYYAVRSGNIFRCVLADDPKSACVIAAAQHLQDESTSECTPGEIFQVVECGRSARETVYILARLVMKAGRFHFG